MNKQRKTSHILNVFQYDADGHVVLPASLTLGIAPTGEDNSAKVPTTAWVRSIIGTTGASYVPTGRTITINGTSYDLSSNRSWSIDTGVLTASAGSGISVSVVSQNLNIVNTGLLTATSGSGISVSTVSQNLNIVNTGLLSATAGAGISVSTVSQNLNIVNTGLLTATAGSGITVSVVNQNLNVVNTGILTASAGSGISLSVVGQNLNVINTGVLTASAGAGINLSIVGGNLNVVNTITNNNQLTNGAGYITSSALTGYATETYVGTAISNLVDAAPGTLDTLNELAAALGDDPNFATTVSTSIGTKVPQARTITINGTSYDLTANRSWTINSMVYPSAGIALSTGTAWGTSITDNSANWNTAYGWGNHASGGYLTTANAATTYASLTGSYANPSWITSLAYSKITGVPAFLTSYTETDTLSSVTGRGASTSTALTLSGGATITGLTIAKSSGVSTITFPAGFNDPAFIQHEETTNNLGIMRFSVSDDTDANDYFIFGGTVSGTYSGTFKLLSNGTVTLGTWQGTAIADTYISSAATWNAKQNALNGTGFVKISGTTISYDNNTYLTGITSTLVTNALGYTPYNAGSNTVLTNVNYTSYALRWNSTQAPANGLDNTGIVPNSVTLFDGYGAPIPGYPSGAAQWWVGALTIGDANRGFQIAGGYADNDMYFRKGNSAWSAWRRVWTDANLTNLNQLTNGPGYITGYTETDTLASVTARGATTSTATVFNGGLFARRAQTAGNYTTAALWTESYDNTTTGIAFHISGNQGKFLEMRTDGVLYWHGSTVWHSGNLTNLNQLTNGPGYITSSANISGSAGSLSDDSGYLRTRGGGSEANLDTYTDNGVRSVSFTGHSQHLLSWNVGGSTGTIQQLFHYGTPSNGWRIRNKTDNSSWSSWGYVVMTTANQGHISGTIYHSGNLTNLNQLTNGPGYITGYTETDTLASVTARGATTSTAISLSGNLTMSGAGNSTSIIFGDASKRINVEGYWMMFKGHENEGFRWQTAGQDAVTYTTRMQLTSSALTINGNTVIHSGTIGSQSVSYASSAGSSHGIAYDGNAISGMGPISNWDSRPGVGQAAFGINWHTGVTISGYGGYGGVRLYASGYPTHSGSVLRLEASGAVYTYGGLYSDGSLVIHAGNVGSYALPIGGGTLTGGRTIQFDTGGGAIIVKGDTGGWSMGTYYRGSSNTTLAGFGAYGGGNSLTWAWIGPGYESPWMTINSGTTTFNNAVTINGVWQTNITTSSGSWNKLSFTATNKWGDGIEYGTLGASGGAEPGVMINNMHATWHTTDNGAGIRMGRSGGVSSGAWYQVATMSNDEFMIAKTGQWSNGGIKILSNGAVNYGNTGYRFVHNNGTWDINVTGYSTSVYIGNTSSKLIADGVWAGTGGYPGYSFTGGNSRFGFSSTGGYIDVYTDGNFYAGIDLNGSNNLVWHQGNLTNLNQLSNGPGYITASSYVAGLNLQGLGNGSVNVNNGGSAVYRNENGAGGNLSYAPVLHLGGGDTMWQIQGDYYASSTLRWRAGYAGSWYAWRDIIHSGNIGSQSVNYATNCGTLEGNSAASFVRSNVNAVTIQRHLDASTTWSSGILSLFLGWYSGKIILGNNNTGGHDYASGLGSNTVVSTNPFFCYQDITAYSDARVKENVEVVENAVEKIKSIRGVTYTRSDNTDKEKRHAGVIAQEVLKVLPEVVSGSEDSVYSVAYGNMAALFIEAIKEQQKQIEELQNKLDNVLSSR